MGRKRPPAARHSMGETSRLLHEMTRPPRNTGSRALIFLFLLLFTAPINWRILPPNYLCQTTSTMFDNTHGGVPSGESGQTSDHPWRGATTTTNPVASCSQQHHQTANMLKRARLEDDGEDERILASSRGMLDGSVAAIGCFGGYSPPITKVPSPSLSPLHLLPISLPFI